MNEETVRSSTGQEAPLEKEMATSSLAQISADQGAWEIAVHRLEATPRTFRSTDGN